jgi:hypothetical protein
MKTIFDILDEFYDQHCWFEFDLKTFGVTSNRATFEVIDEMIRKKHPIFNFDKIPLKTECFILSYKHHDFVFTVNNEFHDGVVCITHDHPEIPNTDENVLFHNLNMNP